MESGVVPRESSRGSVAPDGTPLYVHVPFCVQKCTYCDFFSLPSAGHDLAGTVDLLLHEAERRAARDPRTVFFGGGTPSHLPESDLTRLFEGLEERTGFRSSASEVTVECNPESLTLEKAHLLRELGANRISIGIQTLDPRLLTLFGRVHSVAQSFEAFSAVRRAGFRRVNVDLIYAIPGQELDAWVADLERVLELRPEHVSAYSLAFEEGTVLTKQLRSGSIQRLPEELELTFFETTRRLLTARGYRPYEVSNFSLDGELCSHNCNYWRNGEYVGIGPSAVTHVRGTRLGNPRALDPWSRAVQNDGWAITWEETLGPLEKLGETWWLGLRTSEGIDPAEARSTSGYRLAEDPAERLAGQFLELGLLETSGPAFRLSDRGLPVADAIARRFLVTCSA